MESEIRQLTANEGARIGCKLSSFAFALTVQDFNENMSAKTLQARDGSCIKVVTDDIVVVLTSNVSDEKALYDKVTEVLAVLHTDSEKVGYLLPTIRHKRNVLVRNLMPLSIMGCVQSRSEGHVVDL